MANSASTAGGLQGASPLRGQAVPGKRLGRQHEPGLFVSEVTGLCLASIAMRTGKQVELAEKVEAYFGVALPGVGKSNESGLKRLIWAGPGQWLAMWPSGNGKNSVGALANELSGSASVTDQSDSRAVVDVWGDQVRAVLAKGIMVDLHPRAFQSGDTAITVAAHIGVQFVQLSDMPVYRLMVPRSYALSFWDWLTVSGKAAGIAVMPSEAG